MADDDMVPAEMTCMVKECWIYTVQVSREGGVMGRAAEFDDIKFPKYDFQS
jgi:hypothetical protein